MMENGLDFRAVILNILNRWTALKMAVDHQMGGRQSGEKALHLVEHLHQIFTNNQSVDAEDLEDILVEYMEEEFNTELEDESAIEVSRTLVRLFSMFSAGGMAAAEAHLSTLPAVTEWLDVVPRARPARHESSSSSDSSSGSDGEMDEDGGEWTKVRYGKKK